MKSFFCSRAFFKGLGRFALVGLMAVWLAGCATQYAAAPAAAAAATPDYNYIVGPGDSLNISVWRNPELSMTVPVRPDGKVTMPLVDELVAQGKTPVQICLLYTSDAADE